MRRYLYVKPDGGGVRVSEIDEPGAASTVGGDYPDTVAALGRLKSAKNGEHFTAWYGEAVIIVLVDNEQPV